MKRVAKKAVPPFFQAVLDGKKRYDVRLNDFDIEEGDILVLEEWTGINEDRKPTGRSVEKKVTYVADFTLKDLYTWWSPEDITQKGLKIISLD